MKKTITPGNFAFGGFILFVFLLLNSISGIINLYFNLEYPAPFALEHFLSIGVFCLAAILLAFDLIRSRTGILSIISFSLIILISLYYLVPDVLYHSLRKTGVRMLFLLFYSSISLIVLVRKRHD